MPVAHGGVGQQKLLLILHPVGHRLCALVLEQVARAIGRCGAVGRRLWGLQIRCRFGAVGGLGMSVHRDVGDIGQHFGAAVAPLGELEQVRCLVDELGGVLVVQERLVLQEVLDKGDVGADAANTELAQGAVHAGNRLVRGWRPGGDLGQQAVIIPRDHAARIGRAAIQTDAHAGGRAVRGDAAIVGDKVVLRVFGGDPRLQGVAVQTDVVLRRLAGGLGNGFAFGDQDLRLHDVDAGDLFGDGVFHLHARVHLDEVELAGLHIHQEFDRARAFIVHMGADLAAQLANLFALRF